MSRIFMRPPTVEIILRVGTALTFAGHGAFAFDRKPGWAAYLETAGFSHDVALSVMPLIGCLDWLVALVVLVWPLRPVVLWAVIWAIATAAIRPISGEPVWEMIERGANWACPWALWFTLRRRQRD